MRSILKCCQDAVSKVGFDPPGSLTGSSDYARQLLAIANTVGGALSIRKDWQAMTEEGIFTTVAAEEQFTVLTQFPYLKKIIDDTMFNRTQQKRVRGPVSPQAWQRIKSETVSPSDLYYRLRGGRLYLMSAPEAGETIAFEYYDTRFAATAAGTAKEFFTLDTDVPRIDDELYVLGVRWHFLKEKGFDYGETFREYEDRIESAAGGDVPAEVLNLNPRACDGYEMPDGYIPEGNWPTS